MVSVCCGYLLRAIFFLEGMRLALLQARRWLTGRFCLSVAAEACWRDARLLARCAKMDLQSWRNCLPWPVRPLSEAELAA